MTEDLAHALSDEDRATLRRIATDSILTGLEEGRALEPDEQALPPSLRAQGATFVTLKIEGGLRGCIGSYLPRRSLCEDVARNAYSAAFMDPRFPPLSRAELQDLELHISVLSQLERLKVDTREELLEVLRPGVDGLLLEDPPHRSTFLPQVWASLPHPEEFVSELFRKGGLSPDHWSGTLRAHRYTVEEF